MGAQMMRLLRGLGQTSMNLGLDIEFLKFIGMQLSCVSTCTKLLFFYFLFWTLHYDFCLHTWLTLRT